MWYRYMDMHSGGGQKSQWDYVYVEAESRRVADARFTGAIGREPGHVTCRCCGPDYSVSEDETLEEATSYDRGCPYKAHVTLEAYIARSDVLVLRKEA